MTTCSELNDCKHPSGIEPCGSSEEGKETPMSWSGPERLPGGGGGF